MYTLSKFYFFCLPLCLAIGCKAETDAASDGGTDTETETETETDTRTGEVVPDTTEGMNDCEIMDAVMQNAVDDYCADFIKECCFCLCWNKDMEFDSDAYFDKGECICVKDEDPPQECENAYLEQAQNCVADLDACYDNFYDYAETACLMTPLE